MTLPFFLLRYHSDTPNVAWTGQIPSEFGLLTNRLKYLNIEDAMFNEHQIPDQLFELKGLTTLRLVSCNLVGTISDDIGNLSNLKTLDMSGNNFDIPLPTTQFDQLTSLTYFAI